MFRFACTLAQHTASSCLAHAQALRSRSRYCLVLEIVLFAIFGNIDAVRAE